MNHRYELSMRSRIQSRKWRKQQGARRRESAGIVQRAEASSSPVCDAPRARCYLWRAVMYALRALHTLSERKVSVQFDVAR
ncbi:unnamed protein product [Pieris brassicae]|uniref:Uncharacterized protein n=1 Tax=Pieris brassicae TaxID=7116 RepID=A0A9P0WVD7_PIEBR|nr:unnamed protein product [Pieris brassicae]